MWNIRINNSSTGPLATLGDKILHVNKIDRTGVSLRNVANSPRFGLGTHAYLYHEGRKINWWCEAISQRNIVKHISRSTVLSASCRSWFILPYSPPSSFENRLSLTGLLDVCQIYSSTGLFKICVAWLNEECLPTVWAPDASRNVIPILAWIAASV